MGTLVQIAPARAMELGALWREALTFGHPHLTLMSDGLHGAYIVRPLGNSKVETKYCKEDSPERALLKAIMEAELWGLPKIEDPRP